ncbi:hypothetical protein DXG03_001604 [Asterophora parasitica]|uniref:Uncharacterized protein n=1 Tax=Asterophora parasitica TaxID=117018 RepID=A0A9P7K955_9AGAR|nr:hypothetical protein DXG03_001604 [Asterophora parasitica]
MKQAERLQLDQVLAVSARATGRIPKYPKSDDKDEADADLAFQMYISDAHVMNDAAYAQAIQNATLAGNNKLDPDGRGVGKSAGTTVFPIRCPSAHWPGGIGDDVAVRVLGEHGMVEWVKPPIPIVVSLF